jgi:hypothetical protein
VKRGVNISHILQGSDGRRDLQANNEGGRTSSGLDFSSGVASRIYQLDESFKPFVAPEPCPYFPCWTASPHYGVSLVNWDVKGVDSYGNCVKKVLETGDMALGGMNSAEPGGPNYEGPGFTRHNALLLSIANGGRATYYDGSPMSSLFLPVFEDINAQSRRVVAIVTAYFQWSIFFQDVLPSSFPGLNVVLENNCGNSATYELVEGEVVYVGKGDLHDHRYNYMVKTGTIRDSLGKAENISTLGMKLNTDKSTRRSIRFQSADFHHFLVVLVVSTMLDNQN